MKSFPADLGFPIFTTNHEDAVRLVQFHLPSFDPCSTASFLGDPSGDFLSFCASLFPHEWPTPFLHPIGYPQKFDRKIQWSIYIYHPININQDLYLYPDCGFALKLSSNKFNWIITVKHHQLLWYNWTLIWDTIRFHVFVVLLSSLPFSVLIIKSVHETLCLLVREMVKLYTYRHERIYSNAISYCESFSSSTTRGIYSCCLIIDGTMICSNNPSQLLYTVDYLQSYHVSEPLLA